MQDEALRPISLVGNSGVLPECAGRASLARRGAPQHRTAGGEGRRCFDRAYAFTAGTPGIKSDLIGTETNPTALGFVSVWCSTLPLKRGNTSLVPASRAASGPNPIDRSCSTLGGFIHRSTEWFSRPLTGVTTVVDL